jgi:hypothetical protein
MKPALLCIACALLLAAVAPGGARAAGDADAVLAKYRAFVGWTLGDASVQSLRVTGRIADLSTYDDLCDASRFAQFNTGLVTGRTFLLQGDSAGVRISHGGDSKTLPPNLRADAFTQNMLLCNAFSSYPATLVAQVAPNGTASGSGFAVVALSIPDEPVVLVSINEDTGAITSVAIEGIATYEPAALRNIDAKHRIYTQWKRAVSDSGQTAVMSITTVQLNPNINPDVFRTALDAPPPQDAAGVVRF